MCASQLRP
jgi:DNA invertase Pin-like site-specific DNA recombinase